MAINNNTSRLDRGRKKKKDPAELSTSKQTPNVQIAGSAGESKSTATKQAPNIEIAGTASKTNNNFRMNGRTQPKKQNTTIGVTDISKLKIAGNVKPKGDADFTDDFFNNDKRWNSIITKNTNGESLTPSEHAYAMVSFARVQGNTIASSSIGNGEILGGKYSGDLDSTKLFKGNEVYRANDDMSGILAQYASKVCEEYSEDELYEIAREMNDELDKIKDDQNSKNTAAHLRSTLEIIENYGRQQGYNKFELYERQNAARDYARSTQEYLKNKKESDRFDEGKAAVDKALSDAEWNGYSAVLEANPELMQYIGKYMPDGNYTDEDIANALYKAQNAYGEGGDPGMDNELAYDKATKKRDQTNANIDKDYEWVRQRNELYAPMKSEDFEEKVSETREGVQNYNDYKKQYIESKKSVGGYNETSYLDASRDMVVLDPQGVIDSKSKEMVPPNGTGMYVQASARTDEDILDAEYALHMSQEDKDLYFYYRAQDDENAKNGEETHKADEFFDWLVKNKLGKARDDAQNAQEEKDYRAASTWGKVGKNVGSVVQKFLGDVESAAYGIESLFTGNEFDGYSVRTDNSRGAMHTREAAQKVISEYEQTEDVQNFYNSGFGQVLNYMCGNATPLQAAYNIGMNAGDNALRGAVTHMIGGIFGSMLVGLEEGSEAYDSAVKAARAFEMAVSNSGMAVTSFGDAMNQNWENVVTGKWTIEQLYMNAFAAAANEVIQETVFSEFQSFINAGDVTDFNSFKTWMRDTFFDETRQEWLGGELDTVFDLIINQWMYGDESELQEAYNYFTKNGIKPWQACLMAGYDNFIYNPVVEGLQGGIGGWLSGGSGTAMHSMFRYYNAQNKADYEMGSQIYNNGDQSISDVLEAAIETMGHNKREFKIAQRLLKKMTDEGYTADQLTAEDKAEYEEVKAAVNEAEQQQTEEAPIEEAPVDETPVDEVPTAPVGEEKVEEQKPAAEGAVEEDQPVQEETTEETAQSSVEDEENSVETEESEAETEENKQNDPVEDVKRFFEGNRKNLRQLGKIFRKTMNTISGQFSDALQAANAEKVQSLLANDEGSKDISKVVIDSLIAIANENATADQVDAVEAWTETHPDSIVTGITADIYNRENGFAPSAYTGEVAKKAKIYKDLFLSPYAKGSAEYALNTLRFAGDKATAAASAIANAVGDSVAGRIGRVNKEGTTQVVSPDGHSTDIKSLPTEYKTVDGVLSGKTEINGVETYVAVDSLVGANDTEGAMIGAITAYSGQDANVANAISKGAAAFGSDIAAYVHALDNAQKYGFYGLTEGRVMEMVGTDNKAVNDAIKAVWSNANEARNAVNHDQRNRLKERGEKTTGEVNTDSIKGKQLNHVQKNVVEMLNGFVKTGAMNISLFDSNDSNGFADGQYDPNTNTVYLDISAGKSAKDASSVAGQMMGKVFSHELTHYIQSNNAEGYQQLVNILNDALRNGGKESLNRFINDRLAAYEQRQIKLLERRENGTQLSEEEQKFLKKGTAELTLLANDEAVANACEFMLRDSKIVQEVAQSVAEKNKTLAQKILDFINRFVERVKNAFNAYSKAVGSAEAKALYETGMKNIQAVQKAWDDALRTAMQSAKTETENATESSNEAESRFSEKMDQDYMAAVEADDKEEAAKILKEYAADHGYPVEAYHGTVRADRVGYVFRADRATSGPMAYFTSSEDIATNYSQQKADTSLAYEGDGTELGYFKAKNEDGEISIKDAWKKIPYSTRLRLANNARHVTFDDDWENVVYNDDVNNGLGDLDYKLKSNRNDALAALNQEWLEDGNIYGNEKKFLDVLQLSGITDALKKQGFDISYDDPNHREEKVYHVFLGITNPFVTDNVNESLLEDIKKWWDEQDHEAYDFTSESRSADLWDKRNITVEDWMDKLSDDIENGTTHAWTVIPDAITDYLKSKGYDGIQDLGGKNGGDSHTVYIPFSSEQVKSADPVTRDDNGNVIPLSERFNSDEADIRYSYKGTTSDGIRVYESDFPAGMSQKEKNKTFKKNLAKVFNDGNVTLNVGNKTITVKGDNFTAGKNLYGDSKSDAMKAKINLLYDYADILKTSKMVGNSIEPSFKNPNLKPKNAAHKDVKYWYYFNNRVILGDTIYDVTFNIRDKGADQYEYLIEVHDKGKASKKQLQSIKLTPQGSSSKLSTATKNSVPQTGSTVNAAAHKSEKSNTLTDRDLLRMASDAVAQTETEREYLKMYRESTGEMSKLNDMIEGERENIERFKKAGNTSEVTKATNRLGVLQQQFDRAVEKSSKLEESKPLAGVMFRIRQDTEAAVLDALTQVREVGNEVVQNQIAKYKEQVKELRSRITKLNAENKAHTTQRDNAKVKTQDANEEIRTLEAKLEKAQKNLADLQNRYDNDIASVTPDNIKIGDYEDAARNALFRAGGYDEETIRKALENQAEKYRAKIEKLNQKLASETKEKIREYIQRDINDVQRKLNAIEGKNAFEVASIIAKEQYSKQKALARMRSQREASATRKKIRRIIDNFNARLTKPNANKYIPVDMVRGIVEALDSFDMSYVRNGEEKVSAKVAQMKGVYDALKQDGTYQFMHDGVISEMLTKLQETMGDTPFRNLTNEQLDQVYEVMKSLHKTITEATQLKAGEYARNIFDAVKSMIEETDAADPALKGRTGEFVNWQLTPMRAFRRFGGYTKNSTWESVGKTFVKAEEKYYEVQRTAQEFFQDLTEKKDFENLVKYNDKDLVDVGLTDMHTGKAVKITRGMMLSIYMHLANEDNRGGIMRGGFTIPGMKDYYSGRQKRAFSTAQMRTAGVSQKFEEIRQQMFKNGEFNEELSEAQYQTLEDQANAELDAMRDVIESKLTDFEKKLIDRVHEWNDHMSRDMLNEVTMDIYGFKKASVDNYYPIHRDSDFLDGNFESIKRDYNLENWGHLKERVKASQPIMLTDICYEMSGSINGVARYVGYVRAQRDFNKLYSGRLPGMTKSVKNSIAKKFGAGNQAMGVTGAQYIENLMQDITGSRARSEDSIFAAIRRNLPRATLSANVRVALSQLASIPTAAAALDFGSVARGTMEGLRTAFSTEAKNELASKSAWFWQRYRGEGGMVEFQDMKTGGNIVDRAYNKFNKVTKGKILNWCQATDVMATSMMYKMSEIWVKGHTDLHEGTDEFKAAVDEKYSEVLLETQPMYTTTGRSDLLRGTNELMKMFTMYKTQANQNFNILYDANANFRKMKQDFKNGVNGVTQEDVHKAGAKLANSVVAVGFVAPAVYAVLRFVGNAIMMALKKYKDKDDDITIESVLGGITNEAAGSIASMVVMGSDLYNFAYARITGTKYWGLEDSAVGKIGDVLNSLGNDDLTDPSKRAKLAEDLASMSGIPVGNVKNFINAGTGWIEAMKEGDLFASVHTDTTYMARMLNAAIKGNVNAYTAAVEELTASGMSQEDMDKKLVSMIGKRYKNGKIDQETAERIMRDYAGQSDGKIFQSFDKWDYERENGTTEGYSVYAPLREAAAANDYETAKAIFDSLVQSGIEEKKIRSDITSQYNDGSATNLTALRFKTNSLHNNDKYDSLMEAIVTGKGIQEAVSELKKSGYKTKQIMGAINTAFGTSNDIFYNMNLYNSTDAKLLLSRILDAYEAIGLSRAEEEQWIRENWLYLDRHGNMMK